MTKKKFNIDLAFSIIKHIKKVETNCYVLAKALADEENRDFFLGLIMRGRLHDVSKFNNYEFEGLNLPNDTLEFQSALRSHHVNNSHHPEHYIIAGPAAFSGLKGISYMSKLDIAEMVCDWVARGQEFGTDVRKWIEEEATKKYGFEMTDGIGLKIEKYLNILLTPKFK